ncbi:ABC transporter substrate-binding protein [Stutzerimonas kirkiae]|uniref:Taurine ABC transporter substrate-binding protein n=1 Tax=Stutzerimonas kirkiae TaxID=2211392 RepID=A0A4Q9RBX3_9GAMM|nr:ABC transporter substrate-binding protein [Stutzerimonas kirkiae]TBU98541.1 taurine ABC transporter substrate-binding protein [Stutzerimonas kirkiae]TBV04284.1 taurine ABC transporter substrate-binding protein [Stutzerimonas kirkiae]TBV10988.1 taurine ABC transporter substrate-binding protein [Stutzerimonas kirkiae]TBV14347.1 taurine ABC transporter substrate-binding protein [Stutzerimonas kirkiae]
MRKFSAQSVLRPLACASLALGLAGGANAGTLSIGHTTWVGYGTLYLARDLGYFKEKGLDVEFTVIEEASMYMAAQASGKLSGAASTIDEILKYRPNFCFKAVAALDESHGGDGVLVANDIDSLQDLKGKNIAVNEGSVSQFWLSYLLKQNGMSMADLKVQNMTADDAASAFIAGRVPAAVTWEPNLSLVRQKGQGKVLVDSSQTPGVIVDVVALNCAVIEKQPEDVKALVDGLYRAVQYTREHPQEAYAIMAKGVGGYLSDPAELAEAAKGVKFYDQAMSEKLLGTPGKPGDIAAIIELANETWSALQGKKLSVSYEDLVDPRFVTP